MSAFGGKADMTIAARMSAFLTPSGRLFPKLLDRLIPNNNNRGLY
jgi:hypothetical protein